MNGKTVSVDQNRPSSEQDVAERLEWVKRTIAARKATRLQYEIEAAEGQALAGSLYRAACPRCFGTGHLGINSLVSMALDGIPANAVQWCDCQNGKEQRELYQAEQARQSARHLTETFDKAGVPEQFRGLTLDTFPADKKDGKWRAIAAVMMYQAEGMVTPARLGEYVQGAAMLSHIKPYNARRSLLLWGDYGTGKTGILSYLFQSIVAKGTAGLWIEFYDFCEEVQAGYGRKDSTSTAHLDAARKAPLILLDDVGVKGGPSETVDKRRILWQLVNYRHSHDLPMLLTSNLSEPELRKQFDSRTIERLAEMAAIIQVGGANLRKE